MRSGRDEAERWNIVSKSQQGVIEKEREDYENIIDTKTRNYCLNIDTPRSKNIQTSSNLSHGHRKQSMRVLIGVRVPSHPVSILFLFCSINVRLSREPCGVNSG